ncbi:hypothetical protein GQ53DRAFT_788219 [Thozetella sp. PMI_491]|nr:hypothetical protein GQ53DRAFT_788219 [Thozetella sp. PMI_491]
MPSSTQTTGSTTTTSITQPSGNGTSGVSDNQTLVITLSAVLSAVGALLIIGGVVLCWRYRQKRLPFFHRGISPIDDEEIATWKTPRREKAPVDDLDKADRFGAVGRRGHAKQASTSSRKPPSVIVYNNAYGQGRPSVEGSPPGGYGYYGKISLERDLPATPIQARAPNAVAGLTDESVPGADPFVSTPRRHPSRLSKAPPSVTSPRAAHTRTRSSRSSMRSFGDYGSYGGYGGYSGSSDVEFSPRGSQDHIRPHHGHSRVYSTSELPPRLSLGDDGLVGGLSPRPLFPDEEIGRAIG